MALYDDYLTHDDKPFVENINDALLLSNVFDITVQVDAPEMFSNQTWVNTTSPRKCSVSVLQLKEALPSGVSVSTSNNKSVLTGTGTVKLGWYPNFNAFGKYKSISWTGTGTIKVNLKTTNGATIANDIANGTITSESVELRKLQEIVIEIVLSNATLTGLSVVMENKQSTRYGATVGITDVTGLVDAITAIEGKNTEQDGRISDLENVDAQIFTYDLYSSNYNPKIDTNVTISCRVKTVTGEDVYGKTLTLYKNGTSVATATTNELGVATWTVTCDEWGLQDFRVANTNIQVKVVGETKKLVDGSGILWYANDENGINSITYNNNVTVNANSYQIVKNAYSSGDEKIKYCPSTSVYAPTSIKDVFLFVSYLGEMRVINRSSSNLSSQNVQGTLTFIGKGYH